MSTISQEALVSQLEAMLAEGVQGSGLPFRYFSDHDSLLDTLARLPADLVSRRIVAADPSSTIAAHVRHLVFSFSVWRSWISGSAAPPDWSSSWTVSAVDERQWQELRNELVREYHQLIEAMRNADLSSTEVLGGAMAGVVHMGYHVGAIQQKLGILKP